MIIEAHGRTVEVVTYGRGRWQWYDCTDKYAYSDFHTTKKKAVAAARAYLEDRAKDPASWK